LTTNASGLAGSLVLAGGAGQSFTSMLSTLAVGSFSATYTFKFSDENIAGAANSQIALTLTGNVLLAGDFNRDGVVDAGDYVLWSKTKDSLVSPFTGGDGDGDGSVDGADYLLWQAHLGETATGFGGGGAVPEPGSVLLVLMGVAMARGCWRRGSRSG
jgi:hypothetical protein